MHLKKLLFCSAILLGGYLPSNAQSFVPSNMDFELGTTANWNYYKGIVSSGHVYSVALTTPVTGMHTLMSGTGTDMYGGFPVVGHGLYSLKLSHDTGNNNADAASYNIHVPATGSYSLIYHYAAVLQDAAHPFAIQPIMEVSAVDSTTGVAIPGAALTIALSSSGFVPSTVTTGVYYKPWSTGSVNLAGYGGQTVIVKFVTAACGTGGHFGYGYIDVSSCFASSFSAPCSGAASLVAPPGYSAYTWTDAGSYSMSYGTASTASVAAPTVATTYAVIMTPYPGQGTVDTLYTTLMPAPPTPAAITGAATVVQTHTISLSDATAGGTWTSSNAAVATVGSSTGAVSGITPGTATIMYTLAGGCSASSTITVTPSLAVPVVYSMGKGIINLYPNPTSGDLKIRWADQHTGAAELVITDVLGQTISRSTLNVDAASGERQINLVTLNDGIYLVTIRSEYINYCGRVVIQK